MGARENEERRQRVAYEMTGRQWEWLRDTYDSATALGQTTGQLDLPPWESLSPQSQATFGQGVGLIVLMMGPMLSQIPEVKLK